MQTNVKGIICISISIQYLFKTSETAYFYAWQQALAEEKSEQLAPYSGKGNARPSIRSNAARIIGGTGAGRPV